MEIDPNYDPSDFLMAGLPKREPTDDDNAQGYGMMDSTNNQDQVIIFFLLSNQLLLFF